MYPPGPGDASVSSLRPAGIMRESLREVLDVSLMSRISASAGACMSPGTFFLRSW